MDIIKEATGMYYNNLNTAGAIAHKLEVLRQKMGLCALMGYGSKRFEIEERSLSTSLGRHVEDCLNVPDEVKSYLRTNLPPKKADRIIMAAIQAGVESVNEQMKQPILYEDFLQNLGKKVEAAMYEEAQRKRKYTKTDNTSATFK